MRPNPFDKTRGFTLIEIMIVVVIVAILSTIASPIYQDYVIRSRIMTAIQGLSSRQVQMEQCYQDNHKYLDTCRGCPADPGEKDSQEMFVFTCTIATGGQGFGLTATGVSGKPMDGFEFTVDEKDARSSTVSGHSGWTGSTSCWITSKGGSC
jgi:type IV pilus assembly protein PilE